MGPPDEIISELRDAYSIKKFIETGTHYGSTACWASRIFEHVITIEYSDGIYKQVTENYGHINNIDFMCGDTRKRLQDIVPKLDGPSLFWLDAHWSGGETYGENDQCPIIEEIRIINGSEKDHFIFIDDARLFMSPPQPPHLIDQWPDITTIINALNSSKSERYIVIIEDVIIAVPYFAKSAVVHYCQNVNQNIWEEYGRPQEVKGLKLIFKGVKDRIIRFLVRLKQLVAP